MYTNYIKYKGEIYYMKKFKSIICSILAFIMSIAFMAITIVAALPSTSASAADTSLTSIILSTNSLTVTENSTATFTAALPIGYDATHIGYVVADSNVVAVTPIAYASNVAAFTVNFVNGGSTVIAVYNIDNPAMVAYLNVNASNLILDIPSKLGTNKKNYCTFVSYEFVPYDYTYENFNDYKYTLNIQYKCASYKDKDYNKWGCYGYFYDANGNVIKKVHLYASSLSSNRVYHSEFNVPVNAVKFSIEGFN
jgi:hypothetical protein